MHFGLTEGDAHAQDDPLACGGDAQGDEDGAVAELAVVADFFLAGVEHQIGTRSQGPVAPLLEFGVQEFGAVADLGGTDGGAAEFLDDGGDFAGGDTGEPGGPQAGVIRFGTGAGWLAICDCYAERPVWSATTSATSGRCRGPGGSCSALYYR